MSNDEFAQLFALVQSVKDNMATKQELEEVKVAIDGIRNVLDQHTKMLDHDEMERLALSAQVGRHEDWIARASTKLDIPATN